MKTLAATPGSENNLKLWRQGIDGQVCYPQSHGREHLNIARWMQSLGTDLDPITSAAFDHQMFGVSSHILLKPRASFLAAFDGYESALMVSKARIISDALDGFEQMFGFRSRSFIAPNYVWDDEVETQLLRNGVAYLQGSRVQRMPMSPDNQSGHKRHYLGEKNRHAQTYLVRNVDFEPSANPKMDCVSLALKHVQQAFRTFKPAVISTHRVNFMGGLDVKNRDRGLTGLVTLLQGICTKWPDVEFISSVELGDLITGKQAF